MGIFQLIDYVGIDVFQHILRVMKKYLGEDLHSDLVDSFIERGVKGGQTGAGAQKPGFLDYAKGRPAAVFDPATGGYLALDAPWAAAAEALTGPLPDPGSSWKALRQAPDCAAKLQAHFRILGGLDTLGAELARNHFRASREIGLNLVRQGVAPGAEDVNEVMKLGFFHLYGPISDYLA